MNKKILASIIIYTLSFVWLIAALDLVKDYIWFSIFILLVGIASINIIYYYTKKVKDEKDLKIIESGFEIKKNKYNKVIIVGSIILFIITYIFFVGLSGKISIFEPKTIIYEKVYNNTNLTGIKIVAEESSINVKTSSDNKIKIVMYGDKHEVGKSSVKNNVLDISKNTSDVPSFYYDGIDLYLPKNINLNINIKNEDGLIAIDDFPNINVDLITGDSIIKTGEINQLKAQNDYGDIDVASAQKVTIKTDMGNISIGNISNYLNIDSQYGNVKIKNFNIKENSNIETYLGNVTINNLEGAYVEAESITGNIDVLKNNINNTLILNVQTDSGNIKINK